MSQTRNSVFLHEAAGAETGFRRCEHAGCVEPGVHRAPRGREALDTYYWFCLDHVREYNKSWNFYAGMSAEEVEHYVREDVVGWRPTWPIGLRSRRFNGSGSRFFDPFGFFEDPRAKPEEKAAEAAAPPPLKSPEGKALAIFNLHPPIGFAAIKARYKELVKRHHPDAHGGDKDAEERLKLINEAYGILKRFFA